MLFGNEDIKISPAHCLCIVCFESYCSILIFLFFFTNCSFWIDKRKTQTFTTTHNNEFKGIINENKTAFKAAIRLHLGCFSLTILLLQRMKQRSAYTSSLGSNSTLNLLIYLTKSFIHAGSRTARWLRRLSGSGCRSLSSSVSAGVAGSIACSGSCGSISCSGSGVFTFIPSLSSPEGAVCCCNAHLRWKEMGPGDTAPEGFELAPSVPTHHL